MSNFDQSPLNGLQSSLKILSTHDQGYIKKFIVECNKLLDTPLEIHEANKSDPVKEDEPLLQDRENKYVCFPIDADFTVAWYMYKQQMANFWTAEEIDMSEDVIHWKEKLTDKERHYVSHVLAFFAASDGIVAENLIEKFSAEVQVTEVRFFYGFQNMMECIHSEVYSLFINTLIEDTLEKNKLFNAISTIPSVEKKAKWAIRWINNNDSFAERLVGFACVEGIFFSGSFCSIYWLKKRGLMPGLTFSNELISRDENLHCEFAAYLFKNHIKNKPIRERALEIVKDAVDYEREFVCDALPVDLIGMNRQLMTRYIEFVGDYTLRLLGYEPYYNSKNPFEWMDMIDMSGKTNFFEKRVGEYQKPHVMSNTLKMIREMNKHTKLPDKEYSMLSSMLTSSSSTIDPESSTSLLSSSSDSSVTLQKPVLKHNNFSKTKKKKKNRKGKEKKFSLEKKETRSASGVYNFDIDF